ncbi:conjugal transfer protein TraI [Chitinophaga cymbidii]|uniref:Conjugal transfer protein TraI n=1 Tax=Chitinophaga cymbidii TaxID=1096750 RepID=A0A512RPT2_9BACT|nr:conjugal transfer protein TraI [Chitinophaga cymbidii]GEP97697.1 hypothetical protein CCY01nite_39570 [Chitinophaga cymbidii]
MFTSVQQTKAQLVIVEAIKAVAKKVIRAIDLGVQKLQNSTIDLQNVQKQIENTLSKLKLNEISEWTNRQKELYQKYFEELRRVKAILSYYRQFSDILNIYKQLFEEYKRAYELVTQDNNFSPPEKEYIYSVYGGILEASISSVDDILTIMQSFTIQMSDAERLELISQTSKAMDEHLSALRQFNGRNQLLSLQRAKSQAEIETVKKLYGIQ